MKMLLAAAVLLAASPAAADTWTRTDTVLQGAVFATLAVDYVQTRQIVADGIETNPIMGMRGDAISPEVYFLGVAATHTLASIVLPQPYRRIVQCVAIGVEIDVVHTNYLAGYSVSW